MITIGITTYNRGDILGKSAASLYASDLCFPHNIRIYDDHSSEYDINYLKELFPNAASVVVRERNLKADKNIFLMYKDFLETNDEFFFNADSDLIYNPHWMHIVMSLIKNTDGVLSLFNTPNHSVASDMSEEFCLKNDIGSAGALFTRERAMQIVENLGSRKRSFSVDWKFCQMFAEQGVKIYCTKKSYVQHIGFEGQNSLLKHFDFGEGFEVGNTVNGQILNDVFARYIENVESLPDHKLGKKIMKLPRTIAKLFK